MLKLSLQIKHETENTTKALSKSKARFLSFQHRQHFDDYGNPKSGDVLERAGLIIRYANGYIHAEGQPAIECADGHIEYWQYGRLHNKEGEPAVISDGGEHKEYWKHGKRIE